MLDTVSWLKDATWAVPFLKPISKAIQEVGIFKKFWNHFKDSTLVGTFPSLPLMTDSKHMQTVEG
jgi:hypothetical protein